MDEGPEVGEGGLGICYFFVGGEEVAEVSPGVLEFAVEAVFVGEVSMVCVPGLPEGLGGLAAEFFFESGFGDTGPFGEMSFEGLDVLCVVGGVLPDGGASVGRPEVPDFLEEGGDLVYEILYDLKAGHLDCWGLLVIFVGALCKLD